jgi:hypothetical protein
MDEAGGRFCCFGLSVGQGTGPIGSLNNKGEGLGCW